MFWEISILYYSDNECLDKLAYFSIQAFILLGEVAWTCLLSLCVLGHLGNNINHPWLLEYAVGMLLCIER